MVSKVSCGNSLESLSIQKKTILFVETSVKERKSSEKLSGEAGKASFSELFGVIKQPPFEFF